MINAKNKGIGPEKLANEALWGAILVIMISYIHPVVAVHKFGFYEIIDKYYSGFFGTTATIIAVTFFNWVRRPSPDELFNKTSVFCLVSIILCFVGGGNWMVIPRLLLFLVTIGFAGYFLYRDKHKQYTDENNLDGKADFIQNQSDTANQTKIDAVSSEFENLIRGN